jgi:hypothetical protein
MTMLQRQCARMTCAASTESRYSDFTIYSSPPTPYPRATYKLAPDKRNLAG